MLNKLRSFLSTMGVNSSYVSNDSSLLQFSIEGLNFLAEYKPNIDPTYFRMMLPRIQSIDSSLDNETLERALNVTSKFKVGKVIKIGDYLWISAASFVNPGESNFLVFNRLIDLLRDMYHEYSN